MHSLFESLGFTVNGVLTVNTSTQLIYLSHRNCKKEGGGRYVLYEELVTTGRGLGLFVSEI